VDFCDVTLTPLELSLHPGASAREAAQFATFIEQGTRMLQGQPDDTVQAAPAALTDFFSNTKDPIGANLPAAL
jgi:hypothetical protein